MDGDPVNVLENGACNKRLVSCLVPSCKIGQLPVHKKGHCLLLEANFELFQHLLLFRPGLWTSVLCDINIVLTALPVAQMDKGTNRS